MNVPLLGGLAIRCCNQQAIGANQDGVGPPLTAQASPGKVRTDGAGGECPGRECHAQTESGFKWGRPPKCRGRSGNPPRLQLPDSARGWRAEPSRPGTDRVPKAGIPRSGTLPGRRPSASGVGISRRHRVTTA